MQRSSKLAAVFSPERRLPGAEPRVVRAGGVLGGVEWVVPRAECQYRRVEFPSLPRRQRAAAARIAARRFDPRPQALAYVAWTGPVAHIWTWTGAGPRILAGEDGWIPETLLRAPQRGDGMRLLAQVEGFEGQFWRDGRLHASQWWAECPNADAWQRFERACGRAPATEGAPAPVDAGWSEPWDDVAPGLPASPAVLERWAWTGGLALLACVLGWQLAGLADWAFAQSRLDARMQALRSRAAPLLAARERADTARDALLGLRELQQGRIDYVLVADVVAPLPADARLTNWVREGNRLSVAVRSADKDPRHFVAAYEDSPQLSNVVATPGDDAMGLVFDLDAPAASAGQAAGATP